MRRRHHLQGLLALPALGLPGLGRAQTAPTTQAGNTADAGTPTRAPDVATLLKTRLRYQGVGLLAVQVQDTTITLTADGLARREPPRPLPDDAWFEIGSITKTFTALLLAEAVVRRELRLDDAVEDVLPGTRLRDSAGAPIRWVDLATHRSGLPRLPGNLAPTDPADPYAGYDVERLMAWLRERRPERPRDAEMVYSNLGYGLLGHALGRAAGTDYATLLSSRVLRPLQLADAALRLDDRTELPPRLVDGHDAQGRRAPHWRFGVMAPAGGLVMSGAALGRYAQAAVGAIDTPLREAFALCLQRHGEGARPTNPSGLAWIMAPLDGRTVANHDGGTFGFSTSLWIDPARRRATAVLANAMVGVNDLALHLLEPRVPAQDLSATRQPAITLTAAQLAPLVGSYALNPAFKLAFTLRDGRLFAQATGQIAIELAASAPRRFFARVTPLEIRFDEATPPAHLDLLQNGATLRFVREP